MPNRYTFNLLLIILLVSGLCGCDIINPEEDMPAYLYFEEYDLTTGGGEGSDAHKIADVWVFVNGDILGVYNLPGKIPVLESGATDFVFFPGIKENGIQSAPLIYPFFERTIMTIDLQPGTLDTLALTTRYTALTEFSLVESFEGAHIFTDDVDGNPLTSIVTTETGAFEGESARIRIDSMNPIVEVANNDFLRNLPVNGTDVFLEMHYKTDVELQIGLIGEISPGQTDTEYFYTLFPRDVWNKTYINLAQTLVLSDLPAYKLIFRAVMPIENGQIAAGEAEIYLDNLKLVHF